MIKTNLDDKLPNIKKDEFPSRKSTLKDNINIVINEDFNHIKVDTISIPKLGLDQDQLLPNLYDKPSIIGSSDSFHIQSITSDDKDISEDIGESSPSPISITYRKKISLKQRTKYSTDPKNIPFTDVPDAKNLPRISKPQRATFLDVLRKNIGDEALGYSLKKCVFGDTKIISMVPPKYAEEAEKTIKDILELVEEGSEKLSQGEQIMKTDHKISFNSSRRSTSLSDIYRKNSKGTDEDILEFFNVNYKRAIAKRDSTEDSLYISRNMMRLSGIDLNRKPQTLEEDSDMYEFEDDIESSADNLERELSSSFRKSKGRGGNRKKNLVPIVLDGRKDSVNSKMKRESKSQPEIANRKSSTSSKKSIGHKTEAHEIFQRLYIPIKQPLIPSLLPDRKYFKFNEKSQISSEKSSDKSEDTDLSFEKSLPSPGQPSNDESSITENENDTVEKSGNIPREMLSKISRLSGDEYLHRTEPASSSKFRKHSKSSSRGIMEIIKNERTMYEVEGSEISEITASGSAKDVSMNVISVPRMAEIHHTEENSNEDVVKPSTSTEELTVSSAPKAEEAIKLDCSKGSISVLEDYLKLTSNASEEINTEEINKSENEFSSWFNYNYRGDHDTNGMRNGYGCLKWSDNENYRKYCGLFLYNNMQGQGHYFIKKDNCSNFYNGHFYNNEIHGYGQIVYTSGDNFEGLFKANIPFGPGIYTYKNGTQNVGMWYGNSLFRLNIDLSDCIPSLGRSTFGKIKLLECKKIVPVNILRKNIAEQILTNMKADEESVDKYQDLYNPFIRNQHSLFFDKTGYDSAYFGPEDCYIDVFKNYNIIKTTTDPVHAEKVKAKKLNDQTVELVKQIKEMQQNLVKVQTKLEKLRSQREFNRMMMKCFQKHSSLDTTLENEMKVLQDEELFLNSVVRFLNYKLCREYDANGPESKPEVYKVFVDSLLAWNNGEVSVDVLLHSFMCRNSEENVRFEVKDIMVGERKKFGPAGIHEESCRLFLEKCESSDDLGALKLLVDRHINPDVCDSKGNTGLHFASRYDNVEIIKILANNGANLSAVNDEGITPLNLCLLRYLGLVYDVFDWEFSFLSKHELTSSERSKMAQWRPHNSFIDLINSNIFKKCTAENIHKTSKISTASRKSRMKSRGTMKKLSTSTRSSRITLKKHSRSRSNIITSQESIVDISDRFVFSTEYIRNPERFAFNTLRKVPFIVSSERLSSAKLDRIPAEDKESRMLKITKTIETLLHYGSDQTFGIVPFAPFFMSLFTKSPRIVECFLKHEADPNQNFQGRSPLHITACLEPCEETCGVMETLIKYSANPDILSDPSIWQECDNDLLGEYPCNCILEHRGKNALQLICLREDFNDKNSSFLNRMAEILLEAHVRTRGLYLGHSYLSMAVLKGNIPLIECLSKYLDIKRPLGFGLGNAFTVLGLQRYKNVIPFHICRGIIDLLSNLGISPFEPLYAHQNILEFLDFDSPPNYGLNKQTWDKFAGDIKQKKNLIQRKSDSLINEKCNELTKIYIQEISRKILDIVNRFKAVFYLYCFAREEFLTDYTNNLAKLIGKSSEGLKYLQLIFKCGWMPQSYFSVAIIGKLLKYIDDVNKNEVDMKIKPDHRFESNENRGRPTTFKQFEYEDYCNLVDKSSFQDEFDDPEPYTVTKWITEQNIHKCDVCYFCMHKTGKILLRCSSCGIIKFCSQRCNYLSMKLCTRHACSDIYYQQIFDKNNHFIENGKPIPIYGIDRLYECVKKWRSLKFAGNRSMQEKESKKNFTAKNDANPRKVEFRNGKTRLRGGTNTFDNSFLISSKVLDSKYKSLSETIENDRNESNKRKNTQFSYPTKISSEDPRKARHNQKMDSVNENKFLDNQFGDKEKNQANGETFNNKKKVTEKLGYVKTDSSEKKHILRIKNELELFSKKERDNLDDENLSISSSYTLLGFNSHYSFFSNNTDNLTMETSPNSELHEILKILIGTESIHHNLVTAEMNGQCNLITNPSKRDIINVKTTLSKNKPQSEKQDTNIISSSFGNSEEKTRKVKHKTTQMKMGWNDKSSNENKNEIKKTLHDHKLSKSAESKRILRIYITILQNSMKSIPDCDAHVVEYLVKPFTCFGEGQIYHRLSRKIGFFCETLDAT